MDWLETTDFFVAPASSRYHLSQEGGLLEHSLNVYKRLLKMTEAMGVNTSLETMSIVALFHDFCKINLYKKGVKNVKEDGKWVQKPCYEYHEQFPYGGHGAKSVYLIERFLKLTEEEAVCIHNHMGAYDRLPNDFSLSAAYKAYPLALLLHLADNIATCIDE